jgi:hypothetical protein
MPGLDNAREVQLVASFDNIGLDKPEIELTEFAAMELRLNPSERASLFPELNSPPEDERRVTLALSAASLAARRKKLLEKDGRLPEGVVFMRSSTLLNSPTYYVEGLLAYLARNDEDPLLVGRLRHHAAVRAFVAGIGDGFLLEALASAILGNLYETCYPTQRSFDQGIDCVASSQILKLHSWCCNADVLPEIEHLGERMHIIASCKANEGNAPNGIPATISPAHVRELIGAWLIQRSESGLWTRRAGVKLLSPLQLLLVTTYRFSDASLSMCRDLGVAVWSLTEITFLICRHAPDAVFPANAGFAFNQTAMETWLAAADATRVNV